MKLFLRVGEGATVKVTIPKSWHAQPVRRLLALAVATHNTRGGAPLAEDAAHLSRDGVGDGVWDATGPERFDCAADRPAALAACSARRACVLGNHGAVPADAPWTLEALAADLEDVPCAVLTARDAGAFHYYVGAARDRDTDEAAVPFAAFASQRDPRVYLQAPLFVSTDYRRPPASAPGLGPRLARLATDAFDALAPYRTAAALGPWARTQLFVSRTGATSPLHFDQYANLYLQLAGHKRVSRTGCDIPDFKGSSRPFLSADYRTSDHLSERSRCFLLERARAEHSR
jgi:hypothetical protein